jgi:carbon monoxide dehydrogenase subunit G
MIRFESGVDVMRPVEEVWAYASDVTKHDEWSNAVQSIRLVTPGPIGRGTRFIQTVKMLGKQAEGEWEITEYEPNRRITFRGGSGPMRMSWSMILETIEGGTRIAAPGQCEPGGFFKVASPILRRAMKRQADGDFATLKDLLEATAPVAL